MRFLRYGLSLLCFLLLLTAPAARPASAQTAPIPPSAGAPAAPSQAQSAYTLPPDKLAKAIALNRIRSILDIAGSLWSLVFLWLLLATGAAAALEVWARRVLRQRWLQGLLFFAVFLILSTLADLPLELYGHHLSRSYGISVQGWGSWFLDLSKSLGLSLLIATPVLLLFNWIVRRWPRRNWFAAWLVTLPLMLLSIAGEPLLEPLFYHFEPLARNHPALVAKLEQVVARTGTNIPPDRMFLMDASVKTNGLNAYVSGIGATKRIVVWDTTAGRIPDDEVMFVFGHESGHYVLNHIPKQLTAAAFGLFFVFWGCARVAGWLVGRFGKSWRVRSPEGAEKPQPLLSTRAGFVVLLFTLSVAGFVLEPVTNAVSRHFEHEADVYGQEAIHGLVSDPRRTAVAGFNALGEAWLEDPNPSPFIEFWLYNHPSVKNRANFAAHYDPWANGGRGEFFER